LMLHRKMGHERGGRREMRGLEIHHNKKKKKGQWKGAVRSYVRQIKKTHILSVGSIK